MLGRSAKEGVSVTRRHPHEYAKAATEALSKLSPQERAEFLKMLQAQAAARGVDLPAKVASDPKDLGKEMCSPIYMRGRDNSEISSVLAASSPRSKHQAPIRWGHAVIADGQSRARGHCGRCRQDA